MNSRLNLRLLGEATIELDGRPLADLPSRTAKILLFYLACQNRPVARETLAELLWDERSPAQALANLRSVLSSLRQSLDDFLLVTRETVAFNHEASYWLDAAAFSYQLTSLLTHQSLAPDTVQTFIATLELYRGEFLAGFPGGGGRGFEEWLSLQRERLHRLAHEGLTRLVAYFLTQGQYAEGIPWAQKLLSLDAYDEQARRQMMWLLVRNGQRNAALQVYESGRDLLQVELGVDPTPATRSVYERIRALTVPPPQRLPPEPTPFVGRTEELAQLQHHLADSACRLLTITGSGGIGKTRLALAAAQQLVHHRPGQFLHGTFFVPLSGIGQGSFLATTIADVCSLSLQGPSEPERQLLAHLKERELLLVLDNVEPLLTEASVLTLLDGILQHAPQVKLLITSREPLNLREELLFDVTGLSYPPENEAMDEVAAATYSALALFWQTARRVNRHFAPDTDEVRAISHICRLLEGTPLALELAAAAIRHANSHTIWQAIRHNLDYLETTWHNVPSRHRSLRASYDYSWQRLIPDERVVLSRLAVFQGGFTVAAAQTIAAATPSLLIALQEKSLLRQSGEGRFDMHPLIRQYATEGLAKDKALEQTTLTEHSHYYLDLLSQQTPRLRSAAQMEAYALIGQEIDNVRWAWQQATRQPDLAHLEQASAALYRFYDTRGWFGEGESLFRETVAALVEYSGPSESRSDAAALVIASLSGRVAWFLYQLGRLADAQQMAEASLATLTRLNAPTYQARLLNDLAIYARRMGDYARAKSLFETCLHLCRQLGDEWETARTMSTMANTLRLLGEYAAARELLLESITWQRRQGDAVMLANSLNNLGEVARALGDYAEARRCYEETLVLRRQVDDKLGLGTALNNLSSVAHAQRDFAGAKQYAQESLKILRDLAGWRYTAYPLSVLARTARDEGDYPQALAYFREALQMTWEMGYLPKTLDILFEAATVWLAMGQRAEAVTWLTLVMHHEKINAETRAAADEFLAEAMGGLSAGVLAVAQARGRELTLDALVQQMLRPTSG